MNHDKDLQNLVIKHMLHRSHNKNTICYNIETNVCSKNFPKIFYNIDNTEFDSNGFPKYKRRDNKTDGFYYNKKENGEWIKVDNSMVVPCNPKLLKKYRCHINVEYCASMSTKYIYKYIQKGHDRAYVKMKNNQGNLEVEEVLDEISNYLDVRYVSPMEAAWRIEELPIYGKSHPVVRLAVHLENQHNIIFEEQKEGEGIEKHGTTLTAWFDLNQSDEEAQNYFNGSKLL